MNKNNKAFTTNENETISEIESWLTTLEASMHLGLDQRSLLNEVSNGNIPYYKFGKRNRYLKSELDQMILKNKRGPSWE